MTDRLPGSMLLSLTLHGLIAGLMLLAGYAASLSRTETTKVFELVAGEGDNFAAEAAPAFGEPGGIKVEVPAPPALQPEVVKPPEPVGQPEPTPVAPAPPKPLEKAPAQAVNLSKMIEKKVARADTKAKVAVAKEREAEVKKLTKEEFDKAHKKAAAAPAPVGPPRIAKVDAEGIRKGVIGGSVQNKTGGAGGRALTAGEGGEMDRYFAMLKLRLRAAFEDKKPPGLSDTLVTVVQVRIGADGSLSSARITKSSGSEEFDTAVLGAVSTTHMPPHPRDKSEVLNIPFRMKEQDGG